MEQKINIRIRRGETDQPKRNLATTNESDLEAKRRRLVETNPAILLIVGRMEKLQSHNLSVQKAKRPC